MEDEKVYIKYVYRVYVIGHCHGALHLQASSHGAR